MAVFGGVVQDIGTGGHGFESHAGQIVRSVAKSSPPLRCFFGDVLARCYAAEKKPCHCLHRRNTASIIQNWFVFFLNVSNYPNFLLCF